jgi:antitoxin YefM
MQITNYSNFRKHLKTFMDNCVENNDAIIINREESGSLVLLPLEKYKDIDETEYLLSHKKYADEVLQTFKKMKSKAPEILTPETYAKKYAK